MRGLQNPTQWALNKATDLGGMMARLETRIVPHMDDAADYPTYVAFVTQHRQLLEGMAEFTFWSERFRQLVEQEQKMLGHEMRTARDRADFEANIATPMRRAFWYGWELVHNVQNRFRAANGNGAGLSTPPRSRSKTADMSTVDLLNNEPVWDMLAERVIDGVGPVPEEIKA